MSKISDFGDKVKASNDKIQAAVDNLVGDLKSLNDKIDQLQNSAGSISPEDQAILDNIEAASTAIAEKVEALAAQTADAPTVPVDGSENGNA